MILGIGLLVEPPRNKSRGRPRLGLLDRARASYWAYEVKQVSGKSFTVIERELSPEAVRGRDGGGFEQPHAWRKYANGDRAPRSPQQDKSSPVIRAENRYPGTADAYHSVTWDLLYSPENKPLQPQRLTHRIAHNVAERIRSKDIEKRTPCNILLTPQGIRRVASVSHIDAFGLLLMQWRNGTPNRLTVELIYFTRMWLLQALDRGSHFATCQHHILSLVEEHIPELGVLSGPDGLDPSKSEDNRLCDATMAGFFAGIVSLPDLARIVRQNNEYVLRDCPPSF